MLQAANPIRGSVPSVAAGSSQNSSLLLGESQQSIGGPPPLMEKLTPRERELVLKQGRRKVLNRGPDAVQPGRKTRRHLSDRERPNQGVLHVTAWPRDYAGLLARR